MSGADINTLVPGQDISGMYAIRNKKMLPYRDGSGFFLGLTLADKTGQIEARVWEGAEEVNDLYQVGDVVNVTGLVTEYNGAVQLRLNSLEKCAQQDIRPEQFIPSAGVSLAEVREDWLALTTTFQNKYLQQLLNSMASDEDFLKLLVQCPAAKRNHHARLGGLWQHTLGMIKLAEFVAALYPQTDRDLLITGALLHDIGKVEEYQCRTGINITDEGRLLGHIVLGVGLLDRYIACIPDFPEILRLKLLHLIVSHHGIYEWQSPKRPKFLEAAILHHLDMLDVQVDMFTQAATSGEGTEDAWTGWVRGLERQVFLR